MALLQDCRVKESNMQDNPQSAVRRPTLRDWAAASRPQYYIATVIPITLGFVLAARETGQWRFAVFFLVLLASFLIHLATNLANDLFDDGVDSDKTIGGSEALREGRISRANYKAALFMLYGLYIILSPFIILPSGEPALWFFAAFGIFSSIYYTAPPIRFGYRAMGEALVFLNMGVVMVCGSFMACGHIFKLFSLAFGIVVGLMVAAILYFQSLPEIETDGAAGKRTLAVRVGVERAFLIYRIWWPVIWLQITLLWLVGAVSWPAMGWVCALPVYFKCIAVLRPATGAELLALDSKGGLTRLMYFISGVCLILGALPWS